MTTREAYDIGKSKTLKATSIPVIAYLLVLMGMETRGDFANGILFFFYDIFQVHVIVIMTTLFGLTFLLGRIAGKEIIIDNKKLHTTSIKYSLIIVSAVATCITLVDIFIDIQNSAPNEQNYLFKDLLTTFFKTAALIVLPIMISWFWATKQMEKVSSEEK